jgi:hypothetical protein
MFKRFQFLLWMVLACVTATLPMACDDSDSTNDGGSLLDSATEVAPGPMTGS